MISRFEKLIEAIEAHRDAFEETKAIRLEQKLEHILRMENYVPSNYKKRGKYDGRV